MTRALATAGSIALLTGLLMAPAAQALPMETDNFAKQPAPTPVVQGLGTELAATPVTVRPGTFVGVSCSNAVAGKPVVGQALSLSAPTWSNTAVQGAAVGYQWYREAGPITGATRPSYTVAAADAAQKLWAKVTLSAPGFTSVVLTSAQVTGGKASFVTAPVPTVSGIAKVGQLQSANAGTWAPTGATLSYQWYRGTAAIIGAVSRTYTTTALDYGKSLKAQGACSQVRLHNARPLLRRPHDCCRDHRGHQPADGDRNPP